jgi:hypothetical protein
VKTRLLAILMMTIASPAWAHHSLAMYDSERPVNITGTITKVDWLNPHVWVTLSVKKQDGSVENQRIQISAPGRLKQLGFDKTLLPIGTMVTFEAWLTKDPKVDIGPNGRRVTLDDGRRFDVSDNWPGSRIEPRSK